MTNCLTPKIRKCATVDCYSTLLFSRVLTGSLVLSTIDEFSFKLICLQEKLWFLNRLSSLRRHYFKYQGRSQTFSNGWWGHTMSKWGYWPDQVVTSSFSPPVVGCFLTKEGGGRGSRAPQDPCSYTPEYISYICIQWWIELYVNEIDSVFYRLRAKSRS